MKTQQFKQGDWVFCGMELKQIKEVKDGWISVTCGQIESSSSSFDMFPLDMGIKRISDYFKYHYDKLHREGTSSLNYPDLCRHYESEWARACEAFSKGDHETSTELCDQIAKFTRDTLDAVRETRRQLLSGVQLFR